MPLLVLGINHNSASIELREKLALSDTELPHALSSLAAKSEITECALLSTCNRTEAYIVTEFESDNIEELIADFLSEWHGLNRHEFDSHLYSYREGATVSHLFSVTSGLDSMILGEPDIQRQVKQALEVAQYASTTGPLLNKLFQEALVAGKKTRTETGIARGSFSVGAAAVEYAAQIFGESLAGRTVLVLGAGKMSEVTARHLQTRGAPTILVANRTFEKAEQLANQFGGEARRFDDLPQLLTQADIAVCSTAAPHPIVTYSMVREALRARRGRPLTFFDIAVPRDVETQVDELENVFLFNIDHLQAFVADAHKARGTEIGQAREIIETCTKEFLRWQRSLDVTPLIVAFRAQLDDIRQMELDRLRSRLPEISEKDWHFISSAMQSFTNKIAHPVIQTIKSSTDNYELQAPTEVIRQTFGLDKLDKRTSTSTPEGSRNSAEWSRKAKEVSS